MTRQDDLRKLILKHNRRLQKLKEQQALAGWSATPEISLEIEDIETQIKALQKELAEMGNTEEPLSETGTNLPTQIPERKNTGQQVTVAGKRNQVVTIGGNVQGSVSVSTGTNPHQGRAPTPGTTHVDPKMVQKTEGNEAPTATLQTESETSGDKK